MFFVIIIILSILLTVLITCSMIKNDDKKFDRDLEEKTNEKYLDDDSFLFCCKYGLSVDKKDYTESELAAIKVKALQEIEEIKSANKKKLHSILNQ